MKYNLIKSLEIFSWSPKKQTACLPADYVMHQKDNEAVV